MQQYIGLLLLIVPGFIVRIILESLTSCKSIKSDFDKTVTALIYNLPIMFINYLIIYYWCKIDTIPELILKFNSLLFISKFVIVTFLITLCFAVTWSFIESKLMTKIINQLRKFNKLNDVEHRVDVWDVFLNDGTKMKAISIIKNEREIIKGFVRKWSLDGTEDNEILVEKQDVFKDFPQLFDEVDKVYYNISKDIMIKEYSLEKLYSKLEKDES